MKKSFAVAVFIGFLLVSGCWEGEEVSRYPSVQIPGYAMKDYYRLLSHHNGEVVANAACNLLQYASGVGTSLSDKKIDKKSPEYRLSKNVYKDILRLLASSRDAKIQSPCLRFLQLMSATYKRNNELVEPILKVKSNNEFVRYERICALNEVVSRCEKIDSMVAKNALRDKSWLVSREAYALVNSLQDEETRLFLIKKYYAAPADFEKLLILGAMKNNFSPRIFKFFTQEIVSSKDNMIRHVIFGMLGSGSKKQEVLDWLTKNLVGFCGEDKKYLADTYAISLTEDFSSSLLAILIRQGYTPDDAFFKALKTSIPPQGGEKGKDAEEEAKFKNALRVEAAVLESPKIKDAWLTFKNKVGVKRINPEFQNEYNAAVDRFVLDSDRILQKYNANEDSRKEYVTEVSSLKEYLVEKFGE